MNVNQNVSDWVQQNNLPPSIQYVLSMNNIETVQQMSNYGLQKLLKLADDHSYMFGSIADQNNFKQCANKLFIQHNNNNNNNNNIIAWQWFDGNIWTEYDNETNKQIESAFKTKKEMISLNKGPFFSKLKNKNTYLIMFNYLKNHPVFTQINTYTSNKRRVKRLPIQNADVDPDPDPNDSAILQIYSQLNEYGFNKNQIDNAFKVFNSKYKNNSEIFQNTFNVLNEIMNIMHKQINNNNNNNINDQNNQNNDQKQSQISPINNQNDNQNNDQKQSHFYDINYRDGDWIEICDNNQNWIAGEIVDVQTSVKHSNNKIITVEYEDVTTLKLLKIKLDLKTQKSKTRPLCGGIYTAHTFSFDYDKSSDKKRFNPKNAKHPAAYINRKCFSCKGTGERTIKYKKNKFYPCNRCNGKGIKYKAFQLRHDKCAGKGCNQCNGTGKYPLSDWICSFCNGSGKYYPNKNKNNSNNNNNNKVVKCRHRNCVSGYYLGRLVPFTPKRNINISPHGTSASGKGINNMKRLYHVTNKEGADGIIELGVMFRGNSGGYGGGIYFAENPRAAEKKARQSGYLVIADVYVGKCKHENNPIVDMNFMKLNSMGYDSIRGNWSGHIEYVVYNWDQVWVSIVLPFNRVAFDTLK